jgi:predicted  nucleic acid-binding Zn-ribbon protein
MNIICETCGHIENQESLGAIATALEYGCEECGRTDFRLTMDSILWEDDQDRYLCHCCRKDEK